MTPKLSKYVAQAGKTQTHTAGNVRRVGPISTMDMGRFDILKGVGFNERKHHINAIDKITRFEQLRLDPILRQNISTKLLKSPQMPPTPVQKVTIKALGKYLGSDQKPAEQKQWLIAAETGSGKTLSYLAPILSKVMQEGSEDSEPVAIKNIVLVPTVDLANQVLSAIKKISPPQIRCSLMAGLGHPPSQLSNQVKSGLDIVVASPDKLVKLIESFPQLMARALQKCSTLVVDEADSLMNQSFEPSTTKLINKCTELEHLIFVTATIPRRFDKLLRNYYPHLNRLVTPSIHRLPQNIEFKVVEVAYRPYSNNKQLALQQALYSIYHDKSEPGLVKRVIVFVNLKRDVAPLVNMLKTAGYSAANLDSDRSRLTQFLEPKPLMDGESPLEVLVATDLFARGVDFHRVRNIILYDLPNNAADLLHRAGRTGRLGTKGRVLLFVSKSEEKSWIRGLESVVKRGMALA